MFKFTYFSFMFFIFMLLPSSYAHAGVAPQLGVNGEPQRSDVKRPSNNQPCGAGVNIAAALDTSTAVRASANGDVGVTVLNFNAGADGSRQVSAKVDPSGTGKNFVKMAITVNGDPVPKENKGSQKVVATLPAGTKCAGGSKKDRCLVQFVTNRGFGNCVVVSQGSDAVSSSSSSGKKAGVRNQKRGEDSKNEKDKVATAESPAGKEGTKPGDKEGANKGGKKDEDKKKGSGKKPESDKGKGKSRDGKKKGGKKQKKGGEKKQAGTRAPRALLADLGRRDGF